MKEKPKRIYQEILKGEGPSASGLNNKNFEKNRYAWSAYYIKNFYFPSLLILGDRKKFKILEDIKYDENFWDNFLNIYVEFNNRASFLSKVFFDEKSINTESSLHKFGRIFKFDKVLSLFIKDLKNAIDYRDFMNSFKKIYPDTPLIHFHDWENIIVLVRSEILSLSVKLFRVYIKKFFEKNNRYPSKEELNTFLESDFGLKRIATIFMSLSSEASKDLESSLYGNFTDKSLFESSVFDSEQFGKVFPTDSFEINENNELSISKSVISKIREKYSKQENLQCPVLYDKEGFDGIYKFWSGEIKEQYIKKYTSENPIL